MQTYKTTDGDVLDDIMFRQYGRQSPEMLAALYAANPHLVELPAILPAGVDVALPAIEQPANRRQAVALWD